MLRYTEDGNQQECVMYGDLVVDLTSNTDFTFYVISARIIDGATITVDGEERYVETSISEGSVLGFTKYVGALDTLIFGQPTDKIIHNPEGLLPSVDITIASGYSYTVFAGYPDTVGDEEKFILNMNYNYHEGASTEGHNATESFHLNWTKYDKPAFIVVRTEPVYYNIEYRAIEDDTTISYYRDGVKFGDQLLPTHLPPEMAAKTYDGWFLDYNTGTGEYEFPLYGYHVLDDSTVIHLTDEMNGNYCIVYGPVKKDAVSKPVKVNIYAKDVDGGEYSKVPVEPVLPLLKHDDGRLWSKFYNAQLVGLYVHHVVDPDGDGDLFSSSINTGTGVATLIGASEASWDGYTESMPVFSVYYDRLSVTLKIGDPGDLADGGWESKTAYFEQKVQLPAMNPRAGEAMTGWSSSIADDPNISYEGGVYYYTVTLYTLEQATGGTVTLTADYPLEEYEISFITPFSKYDIGGGNTSTRVTKMAISGLVEVPIPLPDTGATFSNAYAMGGTVYPITDGKIIIELTSNVTLAAVWSPEKFDFRYSVDEHGSVSTNISIEPSEGKYVLGNHTDVLVIVRPASGYDLDLQATLAASSYAGTELGEPVREMDNTYSWSFFVHSDVTLNIKTKVKSTNITFFVDGEKIENSTSMGFTLTVNDEASSGLNIPLYSTAVLGNHPAGRLWYTDPSMDDSTALPHTGTGAGSGYLLTMKEDISLYTTSGTYLVYYHNADSSDPLKYFELPTDGRIQLIAQQFRYDGHIFVGWAVKDGSTKVYSYAPGDRMPVGSESEIHLYAFYLEDGNVSYPYEKIGETETVRTSSISNCGDLSQAEPALNIHYGWDPLNADNYLAASTDPTEFGYSRAPAGDGNNDVYFYGSIKCADDSFYLFGGSYTIEITGNHIIRFYNGETLVEERRIADYQAIGNPPSVSKTDARLTGWVIGTEPLNIDTLGSALGAETRADAVWETVYTITFDSTGGTPCEPITVKAGETAGTLPVPTRDPEGEAVFSFAGWITVPDGLQFTGASRVNGNVNLVATWTTTSALYTVKFYSASGGKDPRQMGSAVVTEEGGTIELPRDYPPRIPGMTFLGWYEFKFDSSNPAGYTITSDTPFDASTPIHENHQLVANWKVHTYTAYFDANGGEGEMPPMRLSSQAKDVPIDASPISREGWWLVGWATTSDGPVVVSDRIVNALSMEDGGAVTLYAVWSQNEHSVTFKFPSGTQIVMVENGNTVPRPADPVIEGCVFSGWFLDDGTLFDFDTPIESNITLTPKWECVVSFDSSGGSAVPDETVYRGDAVQKPANPTKEGYKLVKWTLEGSTEAYDFQSPVMTDIKLIAVWEEYRPIPPEPEPDMIIERETETIENEDGSVTVIEREKITWRSGPVQNTVHETTTWPDGHYRESLGRTYTDGFGDLWYRTVEEEYRADGSIASMYGSYGVEIKDGYEGSVIVAYTPDTAEIYMPEPDTGLLIEAERLLADIGPSSVAIVFDTHSGSIEIPAEFLSEASTAGYSIEVIGGGRILHLDPVTVSGIAQEDRDAVIVIEWVDPSHLTEEQREVIGDNPAASIRIFVGAHAIYELSGTAHVTIITETAYDHAYWVGADGTVEEVECAYDEANNTLGMTITHLSIYAFSVGPIDDGDEDDSGSSDYLVPVAVAAIAAVGILSALAIVKARRP